MIKVVVNIYDVGGPQCSGLGNHHNASTFRHELPCGANAMPPWAPCILQALHNNPQQAVAVNVGYARNESGRNHINLRRAGMLNDVVFWQ